ncbi:hypothetical protein [Bradyrhizobium liaoningense]|uniref:hypothetical protein n=1 Tax=Bradyrhizobium liaoningense TaxID=43992 RepID=UPI001BAC6FB8|nr:hypothetical protein [Bradyrhizobium liaoningense]MBR0859563.1 hypothetical protein [Bradyrhizobium liaoningense]
MEQDLPKEAARAQPAANAPGVWQRIQSWDSRLSVTKGLTAVTLLTGLVGGYFQYISSYDQKMSEQAKTDMDLAAKTFMDISDAFAEVQTQQETMLRDEFDSLKVQSSPAFIPVDSKTLEPYDDYRKARIVLRRNGAIFARKAEIYIDWPSDMGRDAAAEHTLDQDPLTATLLTKYNFDCESEANMPQFKGAIYNGGDPGRPSEELCNDPTANGLKSYVELCARLPNGTVDPLQKVVTINWWSAKHHVLVMHHCFEALRGQLNLLQVPASGKQISSDRKPETTPQDSSERRLQLQARRLDAFMTLTMSQLDRIRVRYRPTGFVCHAPVLREAVGYFTNHCLPNQPIKSERS